MSEADKSGVAEPEESVIRDGKADAENPGIRGWYRGDLNGAYQKWREGGKPEDPTHPLTKKLLSEAEMYAERMTSKEQNLNGETRPLVHAANKKSILRAMTLHDPDREDVASFATYLKRAVRNNIAEQQRREMKLTLQKMLLLAHNGDIEVARWWIDEDRPSHIAPKDRPLAHWLLDQHRNTKITWRHVLRQFPEYKTEDTAGRALKRVKKAIESACYDWSRPGRKPFGKFAVLDAWRNRIDAAKIRR